MIAPLRYAVTACLILYYCSSGGQTLDTVQVRNLHKKAFSFLSTFPDSLLIYRDSSYRLAVALHDRLGVGESYQDLGAYNWVKGNHSAAIHAYDTASQIFDAINRLDKRATNLSNLGMVYSRLGDFPKAINYYLESLRISEQLGLKEVQAKTYNSLGVAYKNQDNLEKASHAYNQALALFNELGNRESVAGCYTNMGNILVTRQQYDQALNYQLKALAIFDSLRNFRGLVTCYNNISDIHLATKNLSEALRVRQQALNLSREKGFFSNEVIALSGIGQVAIEMSDYKTAEHSFLQALDLARKKNYRTELVNVYRDLSKCYKGMGKTADALRYHELYANLKDSLYNQQNLAAISNLQTAYEVDKKEISIQLLKKDNEISRLARNRTMITASSLLLVAALLLVWQRSKIRRDRQLHDQQKKLHETEQALIKSDLDSAKRKEEELLREIAYKNKSLTTYALSMVQKNEILEEVKESIELIIKKPDSQSEHFKKLSRIIDFGFTLDKDWEDFKLYFEDVHTDFFTKLCERFPDLGGADLKLCALIRLNMNVKQSAAILRISPDSVKVARHRLRKKFNLQTEDNLTSFIMSL